MEKVIFGVKKEVPISEIQVLAQKLKIDFTNKSDRQLCLSIQDKFNKVQSENKKLRFVNAALKSSNDCRTAHLKAKTTQVNELKYLDDLNKDKDVVYSKLRYKNEELERMIENLKQELKYYEEKMRSTGLI